MPHLTLDYAANIIENTDLKQFLQKAQVILVETLPADSKSFKSRALAADDYVVGDGLHRAGFVHLHVKVKSGRTQDTLDKAAQQLLSLMKDVFKRSYPVSISVEVQELAPAYFTEII